MRTICVITGTRADYGLLCPLMRRIVDDPELRLQVMATAMHLSEAFGMTVNEIEADGFTVDARIEMLAGGDTNLSMAMSTGVGTTRIAQALADLSPDIVVILGDRYEALSAATAAFLLKIPVAHVHGGEVTSGALDDGIRHAITKLSHLHFASAAPYGRRIVQMGEQPSRVHVVGAMGVDNALNLPLVSRADLERDLGVTLGPRSAIVTFHPATLDEADPAHQVSELLSALDAVEGLTAAFTLPNADPGNVAVRELIVAWASERPATAAAFTSLGHLRYLSAVKAAGCVVGNSSSGIIEAPALGIPTVNIGMRQDGRVRAESVIDCAPRAHDIEAAINRVLDPAFRNAAASQENPYGDGHAAERIHATLKTVDLSPQSLRKGFYDLPEEHA